jgi:hypothetical protein
MKITLAEFNAFQKQLPDGIYFDRDEYLIKDDFWDGKYDPTETIDIEKGDIIILWEGDGEIPEGIYEDFIKSFNAWKNPSKSELVNVKIPKGKKSELEQMIKEKWGEIK